MKHSVSGPPDCIRSGVILTCYINGRKVFRVVGVGGEVGGETSDRPASPTGTARGRRPGTSG